MSTRREGSKGSTIAILETFPLESGEGDDDSRFLIESNEPWENKIECSAPAIKLRPLAESKLLLEAELNGGLL